MKATASEAKAVSPMVFIDTEFTDLTAPQLLSLGAVTLDGREHYVELDLESDVGKQRTRQASSFVRTDGGVLAQWGRVSGAKATLSGMGRRTGEWLLALAAPCRPVRVTFDYPGDFELMAEAIRHCGLWNRVAGAVSAVYLEATSSDCGKRAAENCYSKLAARNLFRHHALADALALRAAYLATRDDVVRLERCILSEGFMRLTTTVTALLPDELRGTFDAETRLRSWLMHQQPGLDHRCPLDVMEKPGGEDQVDRLLRFQLIGACNREDFDDRLLAEPPGSSG